MTVRSADEFYSIMGVLTREILEFGLMDPNHLIKVCFQIDFNLVGIELLGGDSRRLLV